MSMGAHLGQHLSQQQRLSPQLQQSLNILQAPVFELRQMVELELQQNPVLEMESPDISIEDSPSEKDLNDDGFDEEFSRLSAMDEEWRDYMQQSASRSPRTSEDEEKRQFMFDSLTSPVTLQDHLIQQLSMAECTKPVRLLAEMLIGSLDDRGFLQAPLGELSLQQGIPLTDLQAAADIIQTFDPPGVGAEDLRDCLLLQLKRDGREFSLEGRIVASHLDDLARKRFPWIARKLSVPVSEISRAAEHIATLNPRPASAFTTSPQQYITADVQVERQQGAWQIVLNDEQLPRLRISNLYKDLMSDATSREEVRGYIRDKIRSGKFLIRSIQQRQQTIQRIAEQIVTRQQGFFDEGPSQLKPMNMSQIADAVGVHETTVSRAISGKYIATPHGVYELRYFFTSGVDTDSGEQVSNTSVKTALAEIIKGEDPAHPWSDDALAGQLALQGTKLARRTVAKYREELNILPSHLRRQF
jgi:RNA polymerase sigma-54 factor